MAEEVVSWTRLNGPKLETFLFGQALIDYFQFHLERKMRMESEVLSSPSKFVKRWITIMEPNTKQVYDNQNDNDSTSSVQISDVTLISYVPVMMSCQTLMHLYAHSRIEEEYSEKQGFSSVYQDFVKINEEVQRLTSTWMTNALSVEYFINIFSIPLIHFISEVFGRKVGMLLSLSGTLGKVIVITATMFFKLPLDVLVWACAINGITGGTGSFITGIVSHISDKSNLGKSCFDHFSRILALAIGVSGIFTVIFGYIMTSFSRIIVSLCLVYLALVCAIIIIFRFEESQNRNASQMSPTMKCSFRDLWNVVPIRKFLLLFFFLSMAAFSYLPAGGQTIFVTQFFINKSVNACNNTTIGIYLGIFAFSFYITHFFASMAKMEHISSNVIIVVCLLLGFVSSIVLSFTMRMFFYQAVLVNNLVVYTVMYFIGRELSLLVDVRLHGCLYALLFVINLCATSLTLPFLNMIYKRTLSHFPGSLYFTYAAFFLIAASFQFGVWFYEKDKKE
ncbi:uncharacterized protein LOC118765466 [Octopus sinensis]|uniref:Uncharacterized protein LOC118765466 n=1 Tax=Octopus sinensis TaxID=2607531 RepID=A0A7E6F713_9MOLL|nr:uncharacterized protein LOC118765466 [Octopus sinensis]